MGTHLRYCMGKKPMTDPWDERYIYLHEWLSCMVNVGIYASPMDAMGYIDFRSSRNCGGGYHLLLTCVQVLHGRCGFLQYCGHGLRKTIPVVP